MCGRDSKISVIELDSVFISDIRTERAPAVETRRWSAVPAADSRVMSAVDCVVVLALLLEANDGLLQAIKDFAIEQLIT